MEESEVKSILLSLVEQNRNSPSDNIPADVKGWRFPSDGSKAGGGGNENEQYQRPVCFWTGVTCDPIDGSITGLNLGNGFYADALLGLPAHSDDGGQEGKPHARLLEPHLYEENAMKKTRYAASPSSITYERRTVDASPSTKISPSLPSSLGKLFTLRFVNLSFNQLQGSIPREILQLPNLEIFDVSSNDLEGTFPHFASDAIRVLDLSKNRFHGQLDQYVFGHPMIGPHTAPYLLSVVKFDISHNSFNGSIPLNGKSAFYDNIAERDTNLNNLQYFDLGYNLFSGTICNNFGQLEKLQGLFLEHNRLCGTIPKSIFRGSGLGAHPLPLKQLFLQQNSLSGTLNEGLASLPNLKELYVDGNKLTGSVPDQLCNMQLNDVFLNDTQAASRCDGICCPANTISREGVAPCTPCPDDGGLRPYMGQHGSKCQGVMSEVEILDLFFEQTHGEEWLKHEWLNSSYHWELGSPACQRSGIKCNARGEVTKIILPSLGLRGPLISQLGLLSELQVLDLSNNQLSGFIPSDLRFTPLKLFDISGSRMQGVVPPLLCIKEGVNGNGIGPPGINFDLLYACENIACPRGTYSRYGRASVPENEEDSGIQCQPCYDDQAAIFIGRDRCKDISIAGLQIRTDGFRRGLAKSMPLLPIFVFLVTCMWVKLRRGKAAARSPPPVDAGVNNCEGRFRSSIHSNGERDDDDDDENDNDNSARGRSLLSLQRWSSSRHADDDDEHFDDDDWTAADSEAEDRNEMIELARRKARLSGII